jgi:hypothetical protein
MKRPEEPAALLIRYRSVLEEKLKKVDGYLASAPAASLRASRTLSFRDFAIARLRPSL